MNIYINGGEKKEKKCREILLLPHHVQISLFDSITSQGSINHIEYINIVRKENKIHVALGYKELKKGNFSLYIKSNYKYGFTYEFDTKKMSIWKNKMNNEILLDIFIFLSKNRNKYKIYEFDNDLFDFNYDIEIIKESGSYFNSAHINNLKCYKIVKPKNVYHITPSIYKNIILGKIKTKNQLLEHILRYSYKFKKSFLSEDILNKMNDIGFEHETYQHIRVCLDDIKKFKYFINSLYKIINPSNINLHDSIAVSDPTFKIEDLYNILANAYFTNYKITIKDINHMLISKKIKKTGWKKYFEHDSNKLLEKLKKKDRFKFITIS